MDEPVIRVVTDGEPSLDGVVDVRPAARGAGSARDSSEALDRALGHLASLQRPDGTWEGEMVWNTMILSQMVILRAIVGRPFDERTRRGIVRHFEVTRRADGSWGMHPESEGYVFFTTLAYVALRLLGLPADHALVAPARAWLRSRPDGGVVAIPSWGKYWLAFLGLYGYEGTNPAPPEMFVVPSPLHPRGWYCHTRHIYLGISYLWGTRFVADLGPIAAALRGELYDRPYESIDFAAHRHDIAASDLYVKPGRGLRAAFDALEAIERRRPPGADAIRRHALAFCLDRIVYEQRQSAYQGLSPVNAILDTLAIFAADPRHPDLEPSIDGLEAWRWEDQDEGVRYAGARSTSWDTAFALQTLTAHPRRALARAAAMDAGRRALGRMQLDVELPARFLEGREPVRGGWCFSDGTHRWAVSDCTAEAMSALLEIEENPALSSGTAASGPAGPVSGERLRLAAEFILRRQNRDGGFGTYEPRRGPAFLESVNATEMYGACMTERSYVECTASSIAALAHLRRAAPHALGSRLARAVDRAVEKGVALLRRAQRPDGSWAGFWGVNFTYATWHAVRGLRAAGVRSDDPALFRAAAWLIDAQKEDGGWGEHWSSCLTGQYAAHERSQVVQTAWAVLALVEILGPGAGTVRRGVELLRARQLNDGSWPPEAVAGVFFGTAMLDYRHYRAYFPTWALARYEALASRS